RAILKAANLCALEPARAARLTADRGYQYEYALQTMKEIPYGRWREYDPEDTVRFYALRLHEAVMIKSSPQKIIAKGTAWRTLNYVGPTILGVDAGYPLVFLGGVHVGCFEVFGTNDVRSIRDLKGKTVAVVELGGSEYVFLASMAAYVGLDPRKDIRFITRPQGEAKELLAEGKIDGFLGYPPDPPELRARKVGHAVVNSAIDRPWSQYLLR